MKSELEEKGYILFPEILDLSDLKLAQESFVNSSICYGNLTSVNQNYLQIIKNKLDLDLVSMKYRASNNNNSTDAGMFHRDIHLTQLDKYPIYTCLLYLDDSIMEVVPGSHRLAVMTYWQSLQFYPLRKKIKIPAGSILIFHSSLIHRGVFDKPQKNRRLIQQFTCVPRKELEVWENKILHAPCPPKGRKGNAICNQILHFIPIIFSLSNFLVYLNVSRGYAFEFNLNSRLKKPDIVCISPETNQKRIEIQPNILYSSNKFVVNPEVSLLDLPISDYQIYNFYSHWYHHLSIAFKLGFGITFFTWLTVSIL